ncbi:hypothetical protein PBY51_002179 [Eleginops maclovinus]|uniref:Uncharacterized protein n=1 Tax=Eleginops maclovinus TaxID=56733 RepID=A0AAN8ADK4_ELEMC|nr:hypothetical protein PBY51_002179 [Eleginops maclovinus]
MLHLPHKLRLLPPQRGDIPRPQSQLLSPESGPSRPSAFTATLLAAHPTPSLFPVGGGPAGRRSGGVAHVAFSGCARPGSVASPATRRSLTSPPSGPGSRRGPRASSGPGILASNCVIHGVFLNQS